MTDRVGQQLGSYRLLRLLGRGGQAEVYLGEHLYLKSHSALKLLRTSLSDEEVEKFLAEAQTLARLTHPQIVRVHDFAVEQGTPFLVMDYAPGGSLRQRHPRGSCLSLETTVVYIKQMAVALQYAHNHNVIHRDVKPENMLLGPHQSLMLSDFGISVFAPSPESLSTQEMAGTIPYMAPEQMGGKPSFASDQYSLAIVAYEWLCGVRPFEGSFWEIASQHKQARPPRLREKDPSLPEAIEAVILKALTKDPKERYVSVQLFAQALERASQVGERTLPYELQPTAPLKYGPLLPLALAGARQVFLSAAAADEPFVTRLKEDLQERGIALSNANASVEQIQDTSKQEETVRQQIRAADVVLLVASPRTRSSPVFKEHLRIAGIYKRPVVSLWATGDERMEMLPFIAEKATLIDARESRYSRGLDEFITYLEQTRLGATEIERLPTVPDFEPRNPYKGLQAFTQADANDFFGRDALIGELMYRMKEVLPAQASGPQSPSQPARLLAVIGPSGSGKSSVVMAGLLPRLQKGALPGSAEWICLKPLVPGTHPLEALVQTLAPLLPDRNLKSIHEELEDTSARGLHLLATQLAQGTKKQVVLLIDQFEELFTLTTSEGERQHFIDLLTTAVTEPQGPVFVVLTLRADFYDRPLAYATLGRLIQQHQAVVLPMETDDLRVVIKQPAALPDVQLAFEGNLVGDLLFEVRGQVGALPLLQFTLDQLFQRRRGHVLTLQAYREIGGVRGALAKQAEATYIALPAEEHRRLARALFLRLIDPGLTEQDTTRRRAALTELALPSPQETELLQQVTNAFLAVRLLTTTESAGTPTIEVSHEALIREWKRLAEWLREAREDIQLQQTISENAAEWERRNKPGDRLYRGSQLREAKKWARRTLPSKSEVAFLHASDARRTRYLASVLAVLLLLLATSGLTTWLLLEPKPASPNPTLVTTLNDSGVGSLRQALALAKSSTTITFDKNLRGTIVLTSGDLNISTSLTIRGPGATILSISSGDGHYGIHILAKSTTSISGLAFKGSKSGDNSLLFNEGTLTLSDSTISDNTAKNSNASSKSNIGLLGYGGGGILNTGTLTLINSTISNNTAFGDGGGGIFNTGTMMLTNSTISDNTASGKEGCGGGLVNTGMLTLTTSIVSDNTASSLSMGGGGICNSLSSATTLILIKSTVSGNKTSGVGGGIFNFGSMLTINSSVISGNTAFIDPAVASVLKSENMGGGGIFNLSFSPSSSASGQIFGMLVLINTTISDNTVMNGNGGGVVLLGGQASMTACTIYGNSTDRNGGGIAIGTDPTLAPKLGQVVLKNNIVAGNHATHIGADIWGSLTSGGYNLIQNFSGAIFDKPLDKHPTDIQGNQFPSLGIDPQLRNNGGLTETHALLPGSLAIDQIPVEACDLQDVPTDQREVKRPQGPKCDIGAYEYQTGT